MYIRNQTFKDEDTLLEILFDFSLGTSSEIINELVATIEKELSVNRTYVDYFNSLKDEEDRMELQAEESRLRLAEKLMELFESFEVRDSALFGINKGNKKLLYGMSLY